LVVRENIDTNKKIGIYDLEGNKTEINTGANITSDNKMCFVNVADMLFCMNGVDKF
jgi:hypothetical protein